MKMFDFFLRRLRRNQPQPAKIIQLHEMPRATVSLEDSTAVAELFDRVSKQSLRTDQEAVAQ
jgi:hypothetical protein